MSNYQRTRVDEEDDLDDLDDVLDQFPQSAQPTSPPKQSTSAGASTSTQPPAVSEEELAKAFAAELAEVMRSLGTELTAETDARSEGAERMAEQAQLAAAWEAMLVEGMDAMSDPSRARISADASSSLPKEDDFQSRIRSTMNKLKESESDLKSSDSTASGSEDTLQSLLSQLEGFGNLSSEGAESEEDIQGVLEAMMGQLMSKDVLYEPLKELYDKFPEYLSKNSGTISPEDKTRFEAQIACINRLLDQFEAKTYRDDDAKAREKIVELMTELQTHGSPPEEIMGPLPPGFSMGSDGLPNMPDGCNIC